jgi:hypothetical protein
VALDVVEVGEDLLGPSVDLDALADGSRWSLLIRMPVAQILVPAGSPVNSDGSHPSLICGS